MWGGGCAVLAGEGVTWRQETRVDERARRGDGPGRRWRYLAADGRRGSKGALGPGCRASWTCRSTPRRHRRRGRHAHQCRRHAKEGSGVMASVEQRTGDGKSGVEGQRTYVRVALGGIRRIHKKQINISIDRHSTTALE